MPKQDLFHITIGAAPALTAGQVSLERDLAMIKAALLYGDQVKLCSPASSMMLEILAIGNLKQKQQLQLLESVVPALVKDPQERARTLAAIDTFRNINRTISSKKHPTRQELRLREQLISGFGKNWADVKTTVNALATNAGAEGLMQALRSGLLELHPFENWDSKAVTSEFARVVTSAVADRKTFPLFDESTSNLVRAGINEGLVEVSEVAQARAKHSALAGALLERLPLFEEATIEEVLDVRKELDRYLVPFRAAMIRFSEEMKTAAWHEDFFQEVAIVYYREVAPAVHEIEEQVKANRTFLPLTRKLLGNLSTGTIIAFLVSQAHLPDILAQSLGIGVGAITTGYDFLQAQKENDQKAQQNQLFFYYRAGKRLAG